VALAQPVGDALAEHTLRLGTDENLDMAVPADLLVVGAADLRTASCEYHHLANRLAFVQHVKAMIDLIEFQSAGEQLVHR
jgi:hypothetical protein